MIVSNSGFDKDRSGSRSRVAKCNTCTDEGGADCGGSIGSLSWLKVERRKEILPLPFG